MESSISKSSPIMRSPFASPSAGFLLRRRILAWTQETGLPASVRVRVNGKIFNLHKSFLISKSGYFKKALPESFDIELPEKFPGGSETFEMVALFSYDYPLTLDPFNVSTVRCAAELLEMTEDHAPGNLCERSDLYLNQVVLQSWDDTLIVLQKCQTLVPWSEELLIVSRCVESLAFMACMEILDPEQRRERRPVITLQASACGSWNCEAVKEIAGQDLWIKDLLALPFEIFKKIIGSLRRQGMKEKYVSPMIVFYANKWVISKKTHKFWDQNGVDDANHKVSAILQGVLELLLPSGENDGRVIPAAFYFALLSRSLALSLSDDSRTMLHDQVASLLHLAQVEDFLLPESGFDSIASTAELRTMERIVSIRVSSKIDAEYSGCTPLTTSGSAVAELWDHYLSQITIDPKLEPGRFMELIEVVPMADRETHDYLYRAMNTFLSRNPHLTAEEKTSVCKYLNCQKLSQETCIEAVQNELMPLRLIVQALFVQQLNTHQAFKNCSDSFRYMHCGEFSGSLPSSRCLLPRSRNLEESPYNQSAEEGAAPKFNMDYESASFRLQALEEEIVSLKRSLQRQNTSKRSDHIALKKTQSFRVIGLEERTAVKKGTSCIGSLSWASHRKYASRILKVFSRITILGKGKSKIKQGVSGNNACRSKSLHEMYDC